MSSPRSVISFGSSGNSEARSEWDEVLDAGFRYVSWDVFDKRNGFTKRAEETQDFLKKFDRKQKVVYISHKWKSESEPGSTKKQFDYIRKYLPSLCKQFDGFFSIYCCVPDQGEERVKQLDVLSLFIKRCYIFVVDPYEEYKDRFWMLWECLQAAKNRQLIVNDNVKPLLKLIGPNPPFDKVRDLVHKGVTSKPAEKTEMVRKLEDLYLKGAKYSLIPVSELFKRRKGSEIFDQEDEWQSIYSVPLAPDQINPARVLMISHRWETVKHPDPGNRKLKEIREYVRRRRDEFDYFFFDWICIDQQKGISQSLVKVDELYAKSPTLCLCDGDYFERSWCLFEISINKFNADSVVLLPERHDHTVLKWLEDARLVQQMGYVHTLDCCHKVGNTTLELPTDQLHLKMQLRYLFMTSEITNKGDKRIILNLLDTLVHAPE